MIEKNKKLKKFQERFLQNKRKKEEQKNAKTISKELFKVNLNDGNTWSFEKVASNAGSIGYDDEKNIVKIGVPYVNQIIYPHSSIRLSSGWRTTSLPDSHIQHITPVPNLIHNGIISFSQVHTQAGNDIIYNAINNNEYPIKLETRNMLNGMSKLRMVKLHPITFEEELEFNCWHVVEVVLQIATKIIPLFLE